MNELSIETQRRLTEALGEKWCDKDLYYWYCKHCKEEVGGYHVTYEGRHESCGCVVVEKRTRLDFIDSRVTMRLMELVSSISVDSNIDKTSFHAMVVDAEGYSHYGIASTREIAIAKAVDAWLVAQKGA